MELTCISRCDAMRAVELSEQEEYREADEIFKVAKRVLPESQLDAPFYEQMAIVLCKQIRKAVQSPMRVLGDRVYQRIFELLGKLQQLRARPLHVLSMLLSETFNHALSKLPSVQQQIEQFGLTDTEPLYYELVCDIIPPLCLV